MFGDYISRDYPAHVIEIDNGPLQFNFPSPHSFGPFGNDITGLWLTGSNLLRYLALEGPDWIDIHASRVDAAVPKFVRRQAEVVSHLLRALGMRLERSNLMRLSDRIWGVA